MFMTSRFRPALIGLLAAAFIAVRTVGGAPASSDDRSSPDRPQPQWQVQMMPSASHPFIFFHQRKCSGSTWRSIIAASVRSLPEVASHNTSAEKIAYIPCTFDLPCTTWSLPVPNTSMEPGPYVIGGHFSMGEIRHHAWGWQAGLYSSASAFTIFREPVSRVVSCLCYRYPKRFPTKESVANADPEELREFLLTHSAFGFGCNNEPLRAMSGYMDEGNVNALGLAEHKELASALVIESQRHILSRVVLGLMEYEHETAEMVRHFFPWLKVPAHLKHVNSNKKAHQHVTMPETVAAVIANLNAPEVLLYEFARELFLDQVEKVLGTKRDV